MVASNSSLKAVRRATQWGRDPKACIVVHYCILLLLLRFMIITERTNKPGFVRTIILSGIIGCLCFSVGEGLRLTPFPVSALPEEEATNTHRRATGSSGTSLHKYGPLDVPTRVQNRGKRQVDYGNPPSESGRVLTVRQVLLPETGEPMGLVSLLFGSYSTGRAPPFIC